MLILALDTATKTGWCIIQDGEVLESGVQNFAKKRGESNGMLFLKFRAWLSEMIVNCSPSLVVYERAHHRGGAATEIAVNLTGRVQECCEKCGVEYATVETSTLKKFAVGRGRAGKDEMIERAKEILGRAPIDDNEADAVMIAKWAWSEYGIAG